MTALLDSPASTASLYLDRMDPVEPWRPILAGDVFAGVQIPGVPPHDYAMVISHPCSMRRGPDLLTRLQALPVVRHSGITSEQWATGHFRVFPLPELLHDTPDQNFAAQLTEFGMVPSASLTVNQRIACLSEEGIVLALQRLFHCMSRVKVSISTLSAHVAPALEEAALLEEWNETIGVARLESESDCGAILREEAREFDELLSAPGAEGTGALRDGLNNPAQRPAVRRAVRSALESRLAVVTA